jgi:hypothetical protein
VRDVNEVGMQSLDPEYIASLKKQCLETRLIADNLLDHLTRRTRSARSRSRRR